VSEISADAFAFVNTGYAAVAALHDVIAGEEAQVFSLPPGDPHPVAYLRVLLNVQMCRSCFGAGPWDDLEAAWREAYPLSAAPGPARQAIERSLPLLPRIVDLCLAKPSRSFGNRPLTGLIQPARVRPEALQEMATTLADHEWPTAAWWQARKRDRSITCSA